MINPRIWTAEEKEYLKTHYGNLTAWKIANKLDRTVEAVKSAVKKYRVKANPEWTMSLATLSEDTDLPCRTIRKIVDMVGQNSRSLKGGIMPLAQQVVYELSLQDLAAVREGFKNMSGITKKHGLSRVSLSDYISGRVKGGQAFNIFSEYVIRENMKHERYGMLHTEFSKLSSDQRKEIGYDDVPQANQIHQEKIKTIKARVREEKAKWVWRSNKVLYAAASAETGSPNAAV